MAEHDFAQLRAIDFPIWVENSCAELADHFLGYGIFRLEVFVREKIGFDDGAAALLQKSCDRGLSTGDSSGEADGQHIVRMRLTFSGHQRRDAAVSEARNPRRRRAAFTVLLMSIAIVSGPTPPGTGVTAPAISATSGWTSPTTAEPFSRNLSSRSGKLA